MTVGVIVGLVLLGLALIKPASAAYRPKHRGLPCSVDWDLTGYGGAWCRTHAVPPEDCSTIPPPD